MVHNLDNQIISGVGFWVLFVRAGTGQERGSTKGFVWVGRQTLHYRLCNACICEYILVLHMQTKTHLTCIYLSNSA